MSLTGETSGVSEVAPKEHGNGNIISRQQRLSSVECEQLTQLFIRSLKEAKETPIGASHVDHHSIIHAKEEKAQTIPASVVLSEEKVEPSLIQKCIAEAIGTGMIVIFGVGSVNASVFTGAQNGVWQVAVVWALGIMLAIVSTASVSGAHLNPAVSLSFALVRPQDFDYALLPYYITSQFLGAFFCAFINYLIYYKPIHKFEEAHGIVRGEAGSELSAMAFGEYFPNPSNPTTFGWDDFTVAPWNSLFLEAWGTFILVFVIFCVTDTRNTAVRNKDIAPFIIGFTVSVLISLYGPLEQGGFNPARDFGPRLASACLGWKDIAIPGTQNGFWTFIIGPFIGGPLGALFYEKVLRPPA